jgi:hypothetical protein
MTDPGDAQLGQGPDRVRREEDPGARLGGAALDDVEGPAPSRQGAGHGQTGQARTGDQNGRFGHPGESAGQHCSRIAANSLDLVSGPA